MTKTKIALFAIPMCAVLIAVGVISYPTVGNETFSNEETVVKQNFVPIAYAEKPNFQVLNSTDLGIDLTGNPFMQEAECKVKYGTDIVDSDFMYCQFIGEISIPAAIFALSQVPAQDVLSFTGNVIQANSVADSFIGFIIIEGLNYEIENANPGLVLETPNGFEAELSTVCEDLDQAEPTCETSWKVKEMWG
jgi:hypothetical protein